MAERRVRTKDEAGLTLVELLVSMTIFSVVIVVVMAAVITLVGMSNEATERADAQSEIRLGLADISKQMRSGNVLFSPKDEPTHPATPSCIAAADGSDRGSCMRIFTQTNGIPRCVQWQVLLLPPGGSGDAILRTRNWDPDWSSTNDVTPWHTVARGLSLDIANPPFELEGATTPYDRRLLDVNLMSYDDDKNLNVTIESSISGRNTSYGYDTGRCEPIPSENWTP